MLYFSTGNASPNSGGDIRQGDNLFSASIVALDYKTGQYKWHFQEVHHDLWDFDAPSPVVLFDGTYNGQPRKGLYQAGKTGWLAQQRSRIRAAIRSSTSVPIPSRALC